jgi:hypothetical protein
MKKKVFLLSVFTFIFSFNCLFAQIINEKETLAYKNTLRQQVPDKWYLSASAMLRVTLKKDRHFKQLSLDSLLLSTQLDSIEKQGYTAIEIFATPYGGKSYGGLDAIDRYTIDPEIGTMNDFRRLVRQVHRKKMSIIAFDNMGYSSVEAPHFLKACEDVAKGIASKESKWFSWADSINAPAPGKADTYFLSGMKWIYSPVAKKYYWCRWDGTDKNNKTCYLPQYNWSPEWQAEVKNNFRFWMNTGIDGMVVDAVNWYTNYTWQMGKECITDIISSYGNTFIQPEGAGGFHEDPVSWITDGGWNCVQDYGLGIWWEKESNVLINGIDNHSTAGIEDALLKYHDRVVAEGGVLYMGADIRINEPQKYYQYVAFCVATGHLYCKSLHTQEDFTVDKKLANILNIKKEHPAFEQFGRRQKLNTNDDSKYYAFIQRSADSKERILCVFNFKESEETITTDLSGINASSLFDIESGETIKFTNAFQSILPAFGYSLFKIQ